MSDARWRTALHEAGHGLAAIKLCKVRVVVALLLPSGGGVASWDPGDVCESIFDAIVTLAGPMCERLARQHDPPEIEEAQADRPLPTADQRITPAQMEWTDTVVRAARTDEENIAEWAVADMSMDWRAWRRRLVRAKWRTSRFIAEHETEIVAAARSLYKEGAIRLEAAKCGSLT